MLYTQYSEFDDGIIRHASKLGLPLIGGTAMEVLSKYFDYPCHRIRSDNDLDFITDNDSTCKLLADWVSLYSNSPVVQVDVMLIKSHHIPPDYILEVDGVKVMTPEYLIWSKLQRFSSKDEVDIQWLLQIASPDKLEACFERLGITEQELKKVNILICSAS
jgi:hypothetical protein